MKIVVVGPYPPMPGPAAAEGLERVRGLVAAGHGVVTVSPEPSAAHLHLDPGGARGAARLARLVRGADRLVIRLDASALHAGADPRQALPGRVALGLAMRAAPDVEVRLDRVPDRLTAQFVGLLVDPAARVVVGSVAEKEALQRSGVATAKVSVAPAAAADRAGGGAGRAMSSEGRAAAVGALGDHAGAAEIAAAIRAGAAARRDASERSPRPAAGVASTGLRMIPPLEAAPPRSSKPGVASLKRLQRRVLGWQFDWTIQHVNRLHRATVDAIDALERRLDDVAGDPARDQPETGNPSAP